MRIPAQQCRPPIVKLVTPSGTIVLEGEELSFDSEIAPVFLEGGFLTADGAVATNGQSPAALVHPMVGSADPRRRLSAGSLQGFFNSLAPLREPGLNSTVCVPDLPSMPARFKGMSTTLQRCGKVCLDELGFPIADLTGVTEIHGIPFFAKEVPVLSALILGPCPCLCPVRVVRGGARSVRRLHTGE